MPADRARTIRAKIDVVAEDPFTPNDNVRRLRGIDGYRLRVRDWRVLYNLNAEARIMTIEDVQPRGGAYE